MKTSSRRKSTITRNTQAETLSIDRLRQLLSYDPNTGKLHWLPRTPDMFQDRGGHSVDHTCAKWNAIYAGKEAFTAPVGRGHLHGRIWGKAYLAHRVAWAIHYGQWPDFDLDHKDRDKSNNRIENLRPGTKSQNSANRDKQSGCSSEHRGVCWSITGKKWVAYITINGARKHLGSFDNERDAAKAYDAAATEAFGEYASRNLEDET